MTRRITLTLEEETATTAKQIAVKRNTTVSKVVGNLLNQFSESMTKEKNPAELLGILNPDRRDISDKEIETARWKSLKTKNGL